MFEDPVNLFFSRFIFGGVAFAAVSFASISVINAVTSIRNIRQNNKLRAVVTDILEQAKSDKNELN